MRLGSRRYSRLRQDRRGTVGARVEHRQERRPFRNGYRQILGVLDPDPVNRVVAPIRLKRRHPLVWAMRALRLIRPVVDGD